MTNNKYVITAKKALFFIGRNLQHPKFLISYMYHSLDKGFSLSASFFDDEELLSLIASGRSLIRLGDGEIGLMHGKGITGSVFLQGPLPIFKRMFPKMIRGYEEHSPYVLALPKKYISYTNQELKKEGKLRSWLPLKVVYQLLFPQHMKYADAHMFYVPKFFETKVLPIIGERTSIFVINETKVAKLVDHGITKRVYFIKTPPSNAGNCYEEIKKEIQAALEAHKSENPVLLFSCGPIGKVLLYEFCLQGHQGIDVGEGANVLYEDTRIDYLV